jgi:hypothetical protein
MKGIKRRHELLRVKDGKGRHRLKHIMTDTHTGLTIELCCKAGPLPVTNEGMVNVGQGKARTQGLLE